MDVSKFRKEESMSETRDERVKQIMLWTITLTLGTVDLPYYFQVEVSDDLMLLTYERCCMLQCQKVGLK